MLTLTQARVTAIRSAPKGVQPDVKLADGFLHVTFSSGEKPGRISVTAKQDIDLGHFEAACAKAAASFAALPVLRGASE